MHRTKNSREKDLPIRRSIFDKYLLNLNFSKIKIIHVWTKEEQTNEGMKYKIYNLIRRKERNNKGDKSRVKRKEKKKG